MISRWRLVATSACMQHVCDQLAWSQPSAANKIQAQHSHPCHGLPCLPQTPRALEYEAFGGKAGPMPGASCPALDAVLGRAPAAAPASSAASAAAITAGSGSAAASSTLPSPCLLAVATAGSHTDKAVAAKQALCAGDMAAAVKLLLDCNVPGAVPHCLDAWSGRVLSAAINDGKSLAEIR